MKLSSFLVLIHFSIFFFIKSFTIYGQLLSEEVLKNKTVFNSIEQAMEIPDSVFVLKLNNKKYDSLPEEIFKLINLQVIIAKKCRLYVLNHNIYKLKNLQILNLDNNRLVNLPNSLCELENLKQLVICRNMIEYLPDNIGKLKKLEKIVAWGNELYSIPESMIEMKATLKIFDLRQITFRRNEIEKIETMLPQTNILYSNLCDCENKRNK